MSRAALLQDRRFVTAAGAFALAPFNTSDCSPSDHAPRAEMWLKWCRLGPKLSDSLRCDRTYTVWADVTAVGPTERETANFGTQSVGVILLTLGDRTTILLGCVLFGLGVGNLVSLPPVIAQKELRPGEVGVVVALITAINQTTFALVPAFFGFLADATGQYVLPFAVAAIGQVAAAFIVLAGQQRLHQS